MDTRRSDDPAPVRSGNLSRREMLLGIGAGGLAVALLARGTEGALAQDATPTGGPPPGVKGTPLTAVPITDMPTGPFTVTVTRVTLEPGSQIPDSTASYPSFAYLEAGSKIVCPNTDGALVVYDAAGTVIRSGPGEFVWPVGAGCYTPVNTLDGVRNDGTDQGSFLSVELVPTTKGTPVPTTGGGLPQGMSATALFAVPVTDMPTAPFTIAVSRGILVPGAVGGGTPTFPRIVYVEAGEKIMCPPAGEGRVLYDANGNVLASGGAEMMFPVGAACYTSPNSLDGIRNDGTDQGSILSFNLAPTPEGTPTS